MKRNKKKKKNKMKRKPNFQLLAHHLCPLKPLDSPKHSESPELLSNYNQQRTRYFMQEALKVSLPLLGSKEVTIDQYQKMRDETKTQLQTLSKSNPKAYADAHFEKKSDTEDEVTFKKDNMVINRKFISSDPAQKVGEVHISITSPPSDEALLFTIISNKNVVPLRMPKPCNDPALLFRIWQASIIANKAIVFFDNEDQKLLSADPRFSAMLQARVKFGDAFDQAFKKYAEDKTSKGDFKLGDINFQFPPGFTPSPVPPPNPDPSSTIQFRGGKRG